ncbi:MAG: aminopeptidase P N-terminal domain-containing protein [Candidatus Delongbacteria bacterium]|nr:aminopeptidase P N-terminal domain-containing protein [Candidatus Delongbacteria bacterium]
MLKNLEFPKTFFISNRKKLFNKVDDNSVVFIMSSVNKIKNADTFYKFRQDSNFFYFTGLELNRAVLVMTKIGGVTTSRIYRNILDKNLEKWIGKDFTDEEIIKISGIKSINSIKELGDIYTLLFSGYGIENVYMYNESTVDEIIPSYTQVFASNLRRRFNFIKISAVNKIIDEMRSIKSPYEIKMMKRAVEITEIAIRDLLSKTRTGITENECEAILLYNYVKNGSKQPAFQTIAVSGKDATILHYEQNDKKTQKNDLILIDTGAEYKNYAADISRTFPVKGKFSENQKKYYDVVLTALKEVTKAVKPGVTLMELQEISKDVLFKGLKKLKILKKKEELSSYYYHGVSHFLGLDTHDVGDRNKPLVKNNVITVEPGIYIAEKGIGIRLENDILVTSTGHENLSRSIPVEINEIEKIMQGK